MMKCYTHQQIVACVKVAVYAMIKKEVSQSFKCDFSLLMQRCQALSQFRSDRRELISSSQSEFKGGPGWSYIGQLTIFGHFLYWLAIFSPKNNVLSRVFFNKNLTFFFMKYI